MSDPDSSVPVNSFDLIRDALRRFAAERDWDQFHSPKNLAIALSVEASELLEQFQWVSEVDSHLLPSDKLDHVRKELADVLIYLVRLADKLEIDLMEATSKKIEENAKKYPPEKVRGSAKKYTDF